MDLVALAGASVSCEAIISSTATSHWTKLLFFAAMAKTKLKSGAMHRTSVPTLISMGEIVGSVTRYNCIFSLIIRYSGIGKWPGASQTHSAVVVKDDNFTLWWKSGRLTCANAVKLEL